MQLNITITAIDDNDPSGGWVAALWDNSPMATPAFEAVEDTPDEAVRALVAKISVNAAVAADYGFSYSAFMPE